MLAYSVIYRNYVVYGVIYINYSVIPRLFSAYWMLVIAVAVHNINFYARGRYAR